MRAALGKKGSQCIFSISPNDSPFPELVGVTIKESLSKEKKNKHPFPCLHCWWTKWCPVSKKLKVAADRFQELVTWSAGITTCLYSRIWPCPRTTWGLGRSCWISSDLFTMALGFCSRKQHVVGHIFWESTNQRSRNEFQHVFIGKNRPMMWRQHSTMRRICFGQVLLLSVKPQRYLTRLSYTLGDLQGNGRTQIHNFLFLWCQG